MPFYATLHCPVSTTPNTITITSVYQSGGEAYVTVASTYAVTSTLTVGVQVYDDCNMTYITVLAYIYSGNTSGSGNSSGYGACGTVSGSGSSISPSSDGTYTYIF